MNLRRILRIVFDSRDPAARYRPRSVDAGAGWRVFDRRQDRFLDMGEVAGIDPRERLMN